MITTRCTGCNLVLRVQDQLLGKMVKCPNCQVTFSATASADDSGKGSSAAEAAPAATGPPATPQAPPGWIGTLARPIPGLPFQVFGIIAGIVLLAAAIGFGFGAWVAAGIR